MSEFTKLNNKCIPNLADIVHIGDEYEVIVGTYAEKYMSWELTINNPE